MKKAMWLGVVLSLIGCTVETEEPEQPTESPNVGNSDTAEDPVQVESSIDDSVVEVSSNDYSQDGSGDRLKIVYQYSDDGMVLATGQYFDSELGILCGARSTTEGKIRCLPSYSCSATGMFFKDDYCTSEAVICNNEYDFILTQKSQYDSTVKGVHKKGSISWISYQMITEGCQAYSYPASTYDTAGYDTYSLGAKYPLTDFVEIKYSHTKE